MIAQGAYLPTILEEIARLIESQGQDLYCSFLLFCEEEQWLRHGAAPSLPRHYWQQLDKIPVSPNRGVCSASIYWKASIIVEDIETECPWSNLDANSDLGANSDLDANIDRVALSYGLRACWSIPILSATGKTLAALAIYHPFPKRPNSHDGQLIVKATRLAGIAIERHQAEVIAKKAAQVLEEANARLELRVAERTRELTATVERLQQEISDRKQVEESLKQSKATNQALISAIPDMLIRTRSDGTYLNILGHDSFTIHNQDQFQEHSNVYDSLPPHLAQARMQHIHNALKTGKIQRYEQQFITDGGVQDEEVRVVVCGEDEVLIIVRDITTLKQVENALHQSELRNRALITALPDLMIRMNHEGQYLDFIPAKGFKNHIGSLDALGQNVWDILPTDIAQRRMDAIKQALETQESQIYEHQFMVNGQLQFEETRIAVCGEDEVLVIVRDVSDRKQMEEEQRQKAKDLEKALKELKQTQAQLIQTEKMSSLGQLVAGIAHEINNPVNFIYGNIIYMHDYVASLLELLKRYQGSYPEPTPAIAEYLASIDFLFLQEDLPKTLASIRLGADRIRQIVLSLRTFSRLEEAAMKPVDLHEGIDSTLLILQHRLKPQVLSAGIKITKDYGKLPLVECYAGQLNQVFMNILSNALDALENYYQRSLDDVDGRIGQIHIQTELTQQGSVVVRIQDNGPGMSETVRSHIFDPFFTTKPVGKGTGLGLSISYQIVVDKHGGSLQCFSEPGQGTEFIIEIPISQPVKA